MLSIEFPPRIRRTIVTGFMAMTLVFGTLACSSSKRHDDGGMKNREMTHDEGMGNQDGGMGHMVSWGGDVPAGMVGNFLAIPTGDPSTSTVGVKKLAPAEVILGQPYDFTLTAKNFTNGRLENVSISETIPAGLEILDSTPPVTARDGQNAVWNLGDLAPGESRTVRVRAQASSGGEVTTCTQVTYAQMACVTTRVVEPNLLLTVTSPAEVLSCDCFPVKFTVTNTGTGAAKNVVVSAPLPAGFTTQDAGQSSIRIDVGDLAGGESRDYTVNVCAAGPGTMDLTGTATAMGGLTSEASTGTRAKKPMLTISKEGAEWVYGGKTITYTITVKNTGDGEARDAKIVDDLPANVTFVSASDGGLLSGGQVMWNLGTLRPEDTRQVQVTVSATQLGEARNTARTMAYCADAVSATTITEVKGIPAVLLEVVDVEDPIQVGSEVEYVITVTNQGSAPDTNIRITCMLEDEMGYVSSSGASRGSLSGNTLTFEPVPSLAPGQRIEWRVRVRAKAAGDVRFKVIRNTDQTTRPVEETESTYFYQ